MNVKDIQLILDDIEKNDKVLYDHIEMVSMLSYACAKEMNLSYQNREILYMCGLIHEFAKFYIEKNNETYNDNINKIVLNSIFNNNKEFEKVLNLINHNISKENNNEDKMKVIFLLSNEYDNLRRQDLKHEEVCKIIRNKYSNYNTIITSFLKAIIKNELNHEY